MKVSGGVASFQNGNGWFSIEFLSKKKETNLFQKYNGFDD